MELQEINCAICGANETEVVFKTKDLRFQITQDIFHIVRCKKCGFLFLNPRPKKDDIASFYPDDFNQHDKTLIYRLISPCFKAAINSTINLFKRYKRTGKALDIGCGNGNFILHMLKEGYDAFGIEQNPSARQFANPVVKGRITYKDIKDAQFLSQDFDIITMFQSLEHIYDLGNIFCEIKRILKDDGILYVCVPNTDFFEFSLFGPYAYNLEVPRHLYFFKLSTLKALLLKSGFKIDRVIKEQLCEYISTPASFYWSIRYFLGEKKMISGHFISGLLFIPMVVLRFILRLVMLLNKQNLKVLCYKA